MPGPIPSPLPQFAGANQGRGTGHLTPERQSGGRKPRVPQNTGATLAQNVNNPVGRLPKIKLTGRADGVTGGVGRRFL